MLIESRGPSLFPGFAALTLPLCFFNFQKTAWLQYVSHDRVMKSPPPSILPSQSTPTSSVLTIYYMYGPWLPLLTLIVIAVLQSRYSTCFIRNSSFFIMIGLMASKATSPHGGIPVAQRASRASWLDKPADFTAFPELYGCCIYAFMCHHSLCGWLSRHFGPLATALSVPRWPCARHASHLATSFAPSCSSTHRRMLH